MLVNLKSLKYNHLLKVVLFGSAMMIWPPVRQPESPDFNDEAIEACDIPCKLIHMFPTAAKFCFHFQPISNNPYLLENTFLQN